MGVPDTLTQEHLFGFSAGVYAEAKGADALLVSCGAAWTGGCGASGACWPERENPHEG